MAELPWIGVSFWYFWIWWILLFDDFFDTLWLCCLLRERGCCWFQVGKLFSQGADWSKTVRKQWEDFAMSSLSFVVADEHILFLAYLVDEVFDVFRCTFPDFSWTTTLLLTMSCFNSYVSPPPAPPFKVVSGASRESMFSGEAEDEPPFGLLGVGLTRLGLSPLEYLN